MLRIAKCKFEIFIAFTTNPVGKFENLMGAITNFFFLHAYGKNIPVMFQLLHDHIIVESGMRKLDDLVGLVQGTS